MCILFFITFMQTEPKFDHWGEAVNSGGVLRFFHITKKLLTLNNNYNYNFDLLTLSLLVKKL